MKEKGISYEMKTTKEKQRQSYFNITVNTENEELRDHFHLYPTVFLCIYTEESCYNIYIH